MNHFRTDPCNPTLCCNRLIRISWLTVSNAALRSNNRRSVTYFESIASTMSFITFNKAVSVLWPARYDDCKNWVDLIPFHMSMSLFEYSPFRQLRHILKITNGSVILIQQVKTRLFKSGLTSVHFHPLVNCPDIIDVFMIFVRTGSNTSRQFPTRGVVIGSSMHVFLAKLRN